MIKVLNKTSLDGKLNTVLISRLLMHVCITGQQVFLFLFALMIAIQICAIWLVVNTSCELEIEQTCLNRNLWPAYLELL